VGSRASLDVYGKSRPHRGSIPGLSSPQRLAIPTEFSRPIASSEYHKKYIAEFLRFEAGAPSVRRGFQIKTQGTSL
jgi:hypothetical protein